MRHPYHDYSEKQFEDLVVVLCQSLLGLATQGFAAGPDGGRDAKFIGTAELIPSSQAPWKDKTIVQAKHTNGLNMSFSDKDFFSENNASSVIMQEIPRIKTLRENGELDNYLLFSNRRLTGTAESEVRKYISTECKIPLESILLYGIEQLDLYTKKFPDALNIAAVEPFDRPLIVNPDDLAEIIETLAKQINNVDFQCKDIPSERVAYENKNRINNMSEEYAEQIRKNYLKDTHGIKEFLANPENEELKEKYLETVEDFNLKVIAKRKDYNTFDDVMNYLHDFLFARDPILSKNKRLTRAMLFYMYWNCDIGETS